MSVLAVDDHAATRNILGHLCNGWGMNYTQAETGGAALELFHKAASIGHPYDVAIIDLHMPGMDGLALARALKSHPKLASTRLIMLASLDLHETPEAMREAGIEAFLTKPLRQTQLLECIRTAMASGAEARSLSPGLVELRPAALAAPPAPAANEPRLRLLIAEDNPVNQKVALHQLQKLGYRAKAVDNGRAALEAIAATSYDIVFMDCQMPELDGYAATGELRRREGTDRHTWIIAMTANSLEGDREKCLAAGMDDYISKPVKPEKLAEAIKRFLSRAPEEPRKDAAMAPEALALTGPVVDLALLAEFREMEEAGESILEQLIGVFLENSPKLLQDARAALKARSGPLLARAAHTLKGSCSNFGAARLQAVCAALEMAAEDGDLGRASELLAGAEFEFKDVQAALENECAVATL